MKVTTVFAVVLWSWPHLRDLLWLKHKIIQWKTRKWFLTLNYLKVNNKHVWTCMMLNRSTEQTMKQIIKIHEQQAMHIHISYEVSVSIILTFTHIYIFIVYSHQPSYPPQKHRLCRLMIHHLTMGHFFFITLFTNHKRAGIRVRIFVIMGLRVVLFRCLSFWG